MKRFRIPEIIKRRLRLIHSIPAYYLRAAFGDGFHPAAAARSLVASLRERYRPEEAFRLGLLLPGANARTFPQFISKSKLNAAQKLVNPSDWEPLLSDKGMFYRFCEAAQLPVPELYALFFRHQPGWKRNDSAIRTPDEWVTFFNSECPAEFVVKPSLGAYGNGVRVLERGKRDLLVEGDQEVPTGDFVRSLLKDPEYDAFVVQERLHNHADLERLSGAKGLQTVRIMTAVGAGGEVRHLYAFFKIIVGTGLVDNFRSGTAGVLLGRVSATNGVIERVTSYRPKGGVFQVEKHPVTGAVFAGFQLPFWKEAVEVSFSAARSFLPVRTIGWDIGLTPRGPVIVEGNIWYDPPTHSFEMERIVKEMLDQTGSPQHGESNPGTTKGAAMT